MSQFPTPGGGPNQTLLELIFALKGLAQTFDIAHGSLRQLIESESRLHSKELDRLRDLVGKNNQAMAVLPITISDRVEKLLDQLEHGMVEKKIEPMLREILVAVRGVQDAFVKYVESKGESVPQEILDAAHVTGRVELRRDGTVNLMLGSGWASRLVTAAKWGAVGSSGYGIIELLRWLF